MSDQPGYEPDASPGADGPSTGSEIAGAEPAQPKRKRLGKALGKAAVRSPRVEALAQRAQQTAKDGIAAARKAPTVDRAMQAGRAAREAAAPRISHARDGVQQRIADNPDVAAKVARSLTIAVAHAASAHSKHASSAIMKAAPAVGDQVGKTVNKLLANSRTVPALEAGATDLGELAAALGVRPPPDPAVLYRDAPGPLELLFPLPEELASLPWASLSRRNRFYVLVAAWARREADGIQLLQAGQLDQAGEVFQECLIQAEHVQAPELVVRSYTDLAELATASGDEDAARGWRTAAAQVAVR